VVVNQRKGRDKRGSNLNRFEIVFGEERQGVRAFFYGCSGGNMQRAASALGASLRRARDVLVRGRREASSGVLGSAMQAEAATWRWVDSCVVGMGERSSKALSALLSPAAARPAP